VHGKERTEENARGGGQSEREWKERPREGWGERKRPDDFWATCWGQK